MTITQASSILYEWFSANDCFSIDSDSRKIIKGEDLSPDKLSEIKASVVCALAEYEELGLIKSCEINKKKIWVLKKNFDLFDQTVKVSPDDCLSIARIINGVSSVMNLGLEECDPKNVIGKDISNMVSICSSLIQLKSQPEK